MERNTKKFNIRAFVALVIAFSSLGLPITGLANHVYGFDDGLTLTRHVWMSAHNVLGLLLVVFSIWHVMLNRRVMWKYLKGAALGIPTASREAAAAGILVTMLLLLFVGHALHLGG